MSVPSDTSRRSRRWPIRRVRRSTGEASHLRPFAFRGPLSRVLAGFTPAPLRSQPPRRHAPFNPSFREETDAVPGCACKKDSCRAARRGEEAAREAARRPLARIRRTRRDPQSVAFSFIKGRGLILGGSPFQGARRDRWSVAFSSSKSGISPSAAARFKALDKLVMRTIRANRGRKATIGELFTPEQIKEINESVRRSARTAHAR
jgi:hypothetical protein